MLIYVGHLVPLPGLYLLQDTIAVILGAAHVSNPAAIIVHRI